jgi:hypothetical protein
VSIYDSHRWYARWGDAWVAPDDSGIGCRIENFINEFIKANPTPSIPKNPMDAARVLAAQNAPKDVTAWPKNDDAERAAFKQKVAAYYTDETPKTVLDFYNQILESQKPVIYTADKPRRSRRLANKPTPKYFTEEDEQDEIAEVIEAVCAKKDYEYSDEFVAEFNAWLPTADKYTLEKYDYNTDKYIPRTKPDVAKQWAMYYSKSIQEQQKLKKFTKAIVKYCEKNNIEYNPIMDKKFSEWKADPANKKLITYTYNSYSYGCTCGSCDPTGTKMASATEYTYERGYAYCVKQWFSTLKKTIVF